MPLIYIDIHESIPEQSKVDSITRSLLELGENILPRNREKAIVFWRSGIAAYPQNIYNCGDILSVEVLITEKNEPEETYSKFIEEVRKLIGGTNIVYIRTVTNDPRKWFYG